MVIQLERCLKIALNSVTNQTEKTENKLYSLS